MKKLFLLLLLCAAVNGTMAQKITRSYQDQSLSRVLEDLNAATSRHEISFVYNDLEDFTVTCSFERLSLNDALMKVVGFYPVRIVRDGDKYFVECTHKTERHLRGTLIDEQGQPVAFANIAVLNPADSTLLSGGVSNEAGQFVVPYEQHKILVRISFIGYKTIYRLCTQEDMGTIRLQRDSYVVKGVEVKGSVPQYKATTGGMTVEVQNSILKDVGTATGGMTVEVQNSILKDVGTADDLLSMLPRVEGNDGKFTVFAKGEPEIYINNKKVRDSKELKQLKSSDIKSVDIITSPGAKYNAEVNAVIRIKTIKRQDDGLSVEAYTYGKYNKWWTNYDDFTVRYRSGGLEIFGTGSFRNHHYAEDPILSSAFSTTKPSTSTRQPQIPYGLPLCLERQGLVTTSTRIILSE